jgi:hypothetical protein
MKAQAIEFNQFPLVVSYGDKYITSQDCNYWMKVYPPLNGNEAAPVLGIKQLCPWGLAAELADPVTNLERKGQLSDALKIGQHIIHKYSLPAYRVIFLEDNGTKRITVWVN